VTWLWDGVDRLVDRAGSLADLEAHRLELLAARRWRERGLAVPPAFEDVEVRAALTAIAAPALLERVRASCDGPLLLVKGPEIACHYPHPALRRYKDLDLIVPDAPAVQRALLGAGFVEVGDPALFEGIHHLRPLQWPTLPLLVEVHDRPKWPEGFEPPRVEELLAVAGPCSLAVDGVVALPSTHHAPIVAAHAWAHVPLWRLRDLVDVAAVADGGSRAAFERVAAQLGVGRLWRTTTAAIESVLGDAPPTTAPRTWARHLPRVRERTVLENHLQQTLSPFASLAPRRALQGAARSMRGQLQSERGESAGSKAFRAARALTHPLTRLSEHERALARNGRVQPNG
jgi:Uncharacterised nucleotidyltransferase